jgi:hypothetical protein
MRLRVRESPSVTIVALALEKAAPPYIPPTDPKETIFVAKKCAFCGTTNLQVRTTCRNCGKPL